MGNFLLEYSQEEKAQLIELMLSWGFRMEKGLCSISHWLYVVKHAWRKVYIVSHCSMTDVIVGISEVSIKFHLSDIKESYDIHAQLSWLIKLSL